MLKLHFKSRATVVATAIAAAAATVALVNPVVASGKPGGAVPAPPVAPTSADQIQNIDQVKTAIKAYYGNTSAGTVDPVTTDAGDVPLFTFSDNSAYANELGTLTAEAQQYLADRRTTRNLTGQKAILLDVDDTALNTYDYEIYSNFVYNPSTNAAFVDNPNYQLRAVPHMVDLENWAASHGYTVFFLTGRGVAQLGGTQADLHGAGYTFDDANVYTKDPSSSWLQSCVSGGKVTCSTIQYKSLTRQYIESLGYDIVANFGDQYSDLTGGFANATFKIPNPMYYLP